jgi:hypothetical protein
VAKTPTKRWQLPPHLADRQARSRLLASFCSLARHYTSQHQTNATKAPSMASGTSEGDERTPLISNSATLESTAPDESSSSLPRGDGLAHQLPARIANRLYLSHFLSTWNSRVFEFGAVLYLAAIFPGTLLPMSVYALTRGAAAILFSPAVGQYIDRANRLQVVRVSIGNSSCQLGIP